MSTTVSPRPLDFLQPRQMQHKCTYKGRWGELSADTFGCVFKADSLSVEFPWSSVKWIKVTTKYVRDMPTSVLALKIKKPKGFSTRFFNSGKEYFYYFMDIVEAAKQLQELHENWLALKKSPVNISTNESAVSCSESRRSMPDVRSSGSFSFGNSGNRPFNDSGNSNGNQIGTSAPSAVCERERTPESRDLHTDFNVNDGVTSLASTARMGKVKPYMPEDVDNCDNSGQNSRGVNVPFVRVLRKHQQGVERVPSIKNSLHRHADGHYSSKISSTRPRTEATPCSNFRAWDYNSFVSFFLYFDTKMLVVFLLIASLLFWGAISCINKKRNMSANDTLDFVVSGLKQMKQWRLDRHKLTFEGDKQRDSPLMMTNLFDPPAYVSLSDMTIAVKNLLARYVRIQQDLIVLRLHRMRRVYGDVGLSFDKKYQNRNIDDINNVQLLSEAYSNASNSNRNEFLTNFLDDFGLFLDGQKQKDERMRWVTYITSFARMLWRCVYDIFFILRGFLGRRFRSRGSNSAETTPQTSFGNDGFTRYTEVLPNGRIVATNISVEDSKERHLCTKLTQELLHFSAILENLLVEYQDLIMAPLYESYIYHAPPATAEDVEDESTSSEFLMGDEPEVKLVDEKILMGNSDELIHFIFLRRHTISLLQLDPLPYFQKDQYEELNLEMKKGQFTPSEKQYNGADGGYVDGDSKGFSNLEPTRENVETIIRKFLVSTAKKSGTYSSSNENNNNAENSGDNNKGNKKHTRSKYKRSWFMLRNILQEVQYWRDHEDEWETIVLWRLNFSEEKQGAKNGSGNMFQEDAQFRNSISSLPLFRGVWCFLEQPIKLPVIKSHVNNSSNVMEEEISAQKMESGGVDLLIYNQTIGADSQDTSTSVMLLEESNYVAQEAFDSDEVSINRTLAYVGTCKLSELQKEDNFYNEKEGQQEDGKMKTMKQFASQKIKKTSEQEEKVQTRKNTLSGESVGARIRAYEHMSQDVHLGWLNAFDLFLHAHVDRHSQPISRSRLLEGKNAGKESTQLRQRFLRQLAWAEGQYGRYLAGDTRKLLGASTTFPGFFQTHCFSPQTQSWWKYIFSLLWFGSQDSMQMYRCLLLQMSVYDPAICELQRNMLQQRLCEAEDLPWMLLYSFIIPPELLKTHYELVTAYSYITWFFIVAFVSTVLLAIFL